MGVHDGHRKRFKAEFIEKGITAATPPHKILELLLYFCVVQKDTNVLAHELFNKYGSVAAVLDAPIEELAEFKGLSKESALLFKIINPIAGYCQSEKIECMYELSGPDKIGKYMLSKFFGLQNERMAILFIDAFGRNMGFEFVSEGEVDKVIVPIRKILKAAINSGALIAVIAHNHPNSPALPSASDIETTIIIKDALKSINVRLEDHLIIADNDYVSLKQSTEYEYIFK